MCLYDMMGILNSSTHIYMYFRIYTYMHACTDVSLRTYLRTYIHSLKPACMLVFTNTCTHERMQICLLVHLYDLSIDAHGKPPTYINVHLLPLRAVGRRKARLPPPISSLAVPWAAVARILTGYLPSLGKMKRKVV